MSSYSAGASAIALNPGDSVFLFGVLGNAAIAAVGTPGASRAAGTVTITTSAAHNFVIGQRVKIAGVNSTAFGSSGDKAALYGFDGEYEILTVPSTTTFTYADPQKPNDTGGGGTATSIQAETPTPGASTGSSLQVSVIPRRVTDAIAPTLAAELWFTATPGVYEVDMQEADSDADAAYTLSTAAAAKINAAVDANNHSRSGPITTGGRFERANILTRTNAVGLVLKLTCLA